MGRKGVSKRKPSETKTKPGAGNSAGTSVASALRGSETSATKSVDSPKNNGKSTAQRTSKP